MYAIPNLSIRYIIIMIKKKAEINYLCSDHTQMKAEDFTNQRGTILLLWVEG